MAKPSTTLTVRLPSETRDKLDRLAEMTQRSKSFLAAKALDAYAERELEKFQKIEAQMRSTPNAPDPDADEIFAIMERASRNARS
ncbi:CopG family ribbon-helix-helix protein [Pelagibacterium sp.]|uniref:CopG family ribbon-helix-helix protein n=1 Tax=Pelagibacterium sp. TaxID=1967288 RepID=UPI003BACAC96